MFIPLSMSFSRYLLVSVVLIGFLFASCSSDKFLAEGSTVLSGVEVRSDAKHVNASDFRRYVRQEPNSRWFNVAKVRLGIHNMAGTDTTRWANRVLRRVGEAPVVFDTAAVDYSNNYLELALHNKGYLSGYVTNDITTSGRKTRVAYILHPGRRYTINNIYYDIPDSTVAAIIARNGRGSKLYKGMPASVTLIDEERSRIVSLMQDLGYYRFHKELISFSVDTIEGEKQMDMTMHLVLRTQIDSISALNTYRINSVRVAVGDMGETTFSDSMKAGGKTFLYNDRLPIRAGLLASNIRLHADSLYSEDAVKSSYLGLERLKAVKYSSIRFADAGPGRLDALATVMRSSPNTVSAELEGTNTSGDLGAAASLTYSNRNVFRGSETFSLKLRGAYEAITKLEGYSDRNYVEFGGEMGLAFPRFMLPFLGERFRQSINATSELAVSYNLQNRPEFHRRVTTGVWRYRWSRFDSRYRHSLDLLSINYVSMPWISETFRREYLESLDSRNSLLRYIYDNLLIMNMSYSFVFNSRRSRQAVDTYQSNAYQIRFGVETAGNLLYAAAKIFDFGKDNHDQYKAFGVAFSQYAKVDFDFVKSFMINEENSIAFHAAVGLALPYGNSKVIPFEKRYFAGGANSVRGWSVRELGPGAYAGNDDGTVNYIAQTGNLKLDLSIEYRTKLFWKLHGAAFVDAGNVWTTRDYDDQPGGRFKFNTFYKQIAASYGLGLRFNFDYFILRFDGGMKAISPLYESGRDKFPILHPKFSRDFTLHFAVGLPF